MWLAELVMIEESGLSISVLSLREIFLSICVKISDSLSYLPSSDISEPWVRLNLEHQVQESLETRT